MTKLYELTYLARPNLSSQERKSLLEKVLTFLPNEPTQTEEKLSFVALRFNAEPAQIEEIERKIKAESQILRYMIVRKEAQKPGKIKPLRRPKISSLKEDLPAQKEGLKEKVELGEIDKKLKEIFGE